jgi:hypothetical protein
MEVLDASKLEDWNLVMVERHVPYDMVLEVLEEERLSSHDLTDDEINNLFPIIFCDKVDLYQIVEDDGIVYVPDYKAPTVTIDFEKGGDESDDIYE